MTWFNDELSLRDWAGPGFRYPYDTYTFTADLKLAKLASFSLLDESNTLLAFGQYYLRLGCCHLGRLAVSPDYRKKGVGQLLLNRLSTHGLESLGVASLSLFVLDHNHDAIRSYRRFGFRFVDYPEEIPIEGCLYMVK
ncbi:MAG: GNAT family N-acetyltransferase [Acidiferrobacterales bacterium]|nr:GNAT family N-acetyltransferase [Acidiferrobacterales bacterium]